jgi:DNA mismatch repair protein MutS2
VSRNLPPGQGANLPSRWGGGTRSSHALAVLEFERVLERVAERTLTAPGRERVLESRPSIDLDSVGSELARVDEVRALMESRPEWSPPDFPDARTTLGALAKEGAVLASGDLLAARRLLSASRELADGLKSWIASRSGEDGGGEAGPGSRLSALRERLPVYREMEALLARLVDEEGAVRDDASVPLREIRRRLRAQRSTIVRKLERYMQTLPEAQRVEGASVSVRDGRFVIPVRREGRSRVGGVIRGESATGSTLFIEPPLAIELTAEMEGLEREEAVEIQRILRDATGRLKPISAEMEGGFDAQVDFDSLWARAGAARAWGAAVPELFGLGAGEMRIEDGRHPLLLEPGREVIPFSLELGPGERVVVISGPNTGGKTVLLKAIGLIHLLAQSGVIPPVGPRSRLSITERVFADIGDEQSITESLSTFSGHVENARDILAGAGPSTLVLIDEMGTGTDPEEGAALARAILESLLERGALTFVTSHLGALKRLDTKASGIVNASLLFDLERLTPTFRLLKGRPGRSFGLAVARRLGLPTDVLERAEAYVGTEEVKVELLLEELQRKERELEDVIESAEEARGQAAELLAVAEADRAKLEERERTLEREAREQARRLLLDARSEVEAAIEEVRTAEAGGRAAAETGARRRIEEAARELWERTPQGEPSPLRRGVAVQVGDRVRVRGSGAWGVVREVGGRRVTVEVGGVRMRVPRREVADSGGEEAPVASASGQPQELNDVDLPVSHEVDLRGFRLDEVDLALARALDGAVVGGLSELRIIHGKGTGVVKARVRELLSMDRRVSAFRPGGEGEGGSGVTVATLS